jgi:hypothetical protein
LAAISGAFVWRRSAKFRGNLSRRRNAVGQLESILQSVPYFTCNVTDLMLIKKGATRISFFCLT